MFRRPAIATRTETLSPYETPCRSLTMARAKCRVALQSRAHHDAAWQAAGMTALAAETRKGFSLQAAGAGLLAAFVGFASSFAVVIQGLLGIGASPAEAASGLLALSLAMGLCGVYLSLKPQIGRPHV